MFNKIAVIGAGNGGKATAADLALQGKKVKLFEFPEFAGNLEAIKEKRQLHVSGALEGIAQLECVTSNIAEVLEDVDTIVVATQSLTHERTAKEIAPYVNDKQLLILNPNSVSGALIFLKIFQEENVSGIPAIASFSTLSYGCRAKDDQVDIAVKVNYFETGVFPASRTREITGEIKKYFPGAVPVEDVLAAGLSNANPVIHPPIAILNGARFENPGVVYFYKDGVSPKTARLIELLDEERIKLKKALGYKTMTDPELSVKQGYAESDEYYECYSKGRGYSNFTAPDTLNHRYFHEDVGIGLVLYCQLGEILGVKTPASRAVIAMGSLISEEDYLSRQEEIAAASGIDKVSRAQLLEYLQTGS